MITGTFTLKSITSPVCDPKWSVTTSATPVLLVYIQPHNQFIYNNNNKIEFKPNMASTILVLPHLGEVQL